MKWEAHQRLGFFGFRALRGGGEAPSVTARVSLEQALLEVGEVVTVWRQWRVLRVPPFEGGFLSWPRVLVEAFEVLSSEFAVVEGWEMAQQVKARKEM